MLDELRKAVAKRNYMIIDGEPTIVGKYARVTYLEGDDKPFDVWFIGLERQPLSGARRNKLIELYKNHDVTVLDGEAHMRLKTIAPLVGCLGALGLSKRIEVSDERREAASKRLASMRARATEGNENE